MGYKRKEIKKGIEKAINDKKFLALVKKQKNQHRNSNASKKIVRVLEQLELEKIPIQKKLTY